MAPLPDLPARISLDGLVALACARVPASACPAGIDAELAAELERNAASAHPRMLLGRIALARRELDHGDAAAIRVAIERDLEHTHAEFADDHPLLQTANTWRAVALDAAHACTDATQARATFTGAKEDAIYP